MLEETLGCDNPDGSDLPSVFDDKNDPTREAFRIFAKAMQPVFEKLVEAIKPIVDELVRILPPIVDELTRLISRLTLEQIESLLNALTDNRKRAAQRIRRTSWDYCVWAAPAQPHKVDYG